MGKKNRRNNKPKKHLKEVINMAKHYAMQTVMTLGDARKLSKKRRFVRGMAKSKKLPMTDEQAQWYLARNPLLALAILES